MTGRSGSDSGSLSRGKCLGARLWALVLLCLLASLPLPGITSTSPAARPETRVWDFDLAYLVGVEVERSLTPELRPGCDLSYDDWMSGSPIAAKGGVPKPRVKKMTPDPSAKGPHSTWKADGDGLVGAGICGRGGEGREDNRVHAARLEPSLG